MIKVAINGFGRIGREFFRQASKINDLKIVAINDLSDKENLEYLLNYDSAHGHFNFSLESINFYQEKDPENLPWGELGIDIVLESTGFFKEYELAEKHIKAGAKRVVVSAPSKDIPTVLMGVNDSELEKHQISSNASCTTNAIAATLYALDNFVGVKKAILSTTHSYTSTQRLVDSPNSKDYRRGRAAAVNIIPTSTGAAKATTKVLTSLDQKFDGIALRVPTITGSIADLTVLLERQSSKEEINTFLKEKAQNELKGILDYSEEDLVSSDIIGKEVAATLDAKMTMLVDGDLLKLLLWYDNESGYVSTLVKHVLKSAESIK